MTMLCAYPRTLKSRAMWPMAKRLLLGRFTEGLNRLRDILVEEGAAAPERRGQVAAQPVEAAGASD